MSNVDEREHLSIFYILTIFLICCGHCKSTVVKKEKSSNATTSLVVVLGSGADYGNLNVGRRFQFTGQQNGSKWWNPENWVIQEHDQLENSCTKALPDVYRVPSCMDTVAFPKDFNIDIIGTVTVKEVIFTDVILTNDEQLQSYLGTDGARTGFNFLTPQSSLNLSSSKLCQRPAEENIRNNVCPLVKCSSSTRCQHPVRLTKYCCPQCAALLRFTKNRLDVLRRGFGELERFLKEDYVGAQLLGTVSGGGADVLVVVSNVFNETAATVASQKVDQFVEDKVSYLLRESTLIKEEIRASHHVRFKVYGIVIKVVIPIVLLALLLIGAFRYYRKRKLPKPKRRRFGTDFSVSQYPGVNDLEIPTDKFDGIDFKDTGVLDNRVFNPALRKLQNQTSLDMVSPEFIIPVDYVPSRRRLSVADPKVLRYNNSSTRIQPTTESTIPNDINSKPMVPADAPTLDKKRTASQTKSITNPTFEECETTRPPSKDEEIEADMFVPDPDHSGEETDENLTFDLGSLRTTPASVDLVYNDDNMNLSRMKLELKYLSPSSDEVSTTGNDND